MQVECIKATLFAYKHITCTECLEKESINKWKCMKVSCLLSKWNNIYTVQSTQAASSSKHIYIARQYVRFNLVLKHVRCTYVSKTSVYDSLWTLGNRMKHTSHQWPVEVYNNGKADPIPSLLPYLLQGRQLKIIIHVLVATSYVTASVLCEHMLSKLLIM